MYSEQKNFKEIKSQIQNPFESDNLEKNKE